MEWAFGIYFYKRENVQDSNNLGRQLAQQNQEESKKENDIVYTSVVQTKLSPNCQIIEKEYFKGCDHLIKTSKEIPKEWTNWSEDQIKIQYMGWNIEKFSNNQIVVYKEKEGICPQHYLIKVHDGVLGIYNLDEDGKENWKQDTEIATKYLSEEDLYKLKEGISAVGDAQLHTVLEDFE